MADFAICQGGRVSIWCRSRGTLKNGTRKFEVINGGWTGFITKAGEVHTTKDGKAGTGTVCWEGVAPFRWDDYNEAIVWIEEQIRDQKL